MNAGAIVYSILMQGAAVFQREATAAEQAVTKVGAAADKSKPKVAGVGDEIDKTGDAAKRAKGPLDGTAKATDDVGKQSSQAAPKVKSVRQEISGLSTEGQQAARTIGTSMLAIGTAIAVVGGVAVAKFADFEVGVDRTTAAIGASAAESRQLSEAALQAGADSVFSAREAADAQTELAKAGLSVKDVLTGGLTGSLALAAAGELDVARAGEIAAITLKQFKLEGDQAGRVADVLAAGAGKAVGSVDDLANGLKFVGPVAQSMNVSLEETVGVLALFAKNGIIGEQGGTAFRGMLSSLTSPSKIARAEIEKLGINLYDAEGGFLGVENAAGELEKAYGGLTDEQRDASLGILFGNEQITTARILYQEGAAGVREMTAAVSENGFAAEQAAALTDNLAGDIERLGGAVDSALISTGSAANDVLRDMVQVITTLVDGYASMPAETQAVVLGVAGVSAAVLIGSGVFLLAIPKIAEYRLALQTLSTEMPKTATAAKGLFGILGGPWGIALIAATTILSFFISQQADVAAAIDEHSNALDQNTGALTENNRQIAINELQSNGAFDAAKKLGLGLDTITDAALGNSEQMAIVRERLNEVAASAEAAAQDQSLYTAAQVEMEGAADVLDNRLTIQNETIDKSVEKWREQAEAQGESKESTEGTAEAYLAANTEASGLLDTLTELVTTIAEANGLGQDAVTSNAAYQESLQSVKDTIADLDPETGKARTGVEALARTVDESTVAGSANADMFAELAAKSEAAAQAQLKVDGDTGKYIATVTAGRQALYDQILALTGNADAAQTLTDKIYAIPDEAEVKVLAETAEATEKVERFIRGVNGRRVQVTVDAVGGKTYRVEGTDVQFNRDGGVVDYFARGGFARENHVAQIARAGAMRVWAEPETGGEAYIPLAPSKRGRSIDIWRETGRRLGVEHFADGGFYGGGGSRGGDTWNIWEAASARATAVEVAQIQKSRSA